MIFNLLSNIIIFVLGIIFGAIVGASLYSIYLHNPNFSQLIKNKNSIKYNILLISQKWYNFIEKIIPKNIMN
ncbi:MAG: hypothetical protein Q8885_01935 [Candidatus Phytoplasma stylosanthis]|nr:hypothetical protein [Candidatus Phytoplasma stylosanthis]